MNFDAVILAGGKSSRMGRDKAFVDFRGAPLIAHAINRLQPQVSMLAIAANSDPARFATFHAPVLADRDETRPGPLAGVAAGLLFARQQGCAAIVTTPCDAPFAPRDLVQRLLSAGGANAPAVAASERGVEPLFGLWPVKALADVEAALARRDTAVWRLLEALNAARVEIPVAGPEDWRLNLNTPAELAAAEHSPGI